MSDANLFDERNHAVLLTASAVCERIGKEFRTAPLKVEIVSGIRVEELERAASLLVVKVVGVLRLDKDFGLAWQRAGTNQGASEDGAAKVVVFALRSDRGVLCF